MMREKQKESGVTGNKKKMPADETTPEKDEKSAMEI